MNRGALLEIEILQSENNIYTFRIVQQTLRGDEFNPRDKHRSFIASNGYHLVSAIFPAVHSSTLFVRGNNKKLDDKTLEIEEETFRLILQAIDEYNMAYAQHEKTTVAHKSHLRLPLK